MGKNGAIGREQLAPPGHEGGALADAEVFEQLFHILDLVGGISRTCSSGWSRTVTLGISKGRG